MVIIPLLLMGCGGVGCELLRHIVFCRRVHSDQGVTLRVMGICDSKIMVAVPDISTSGFDDKFLLQFCKHKTCGVPLQKLADSGECLLFSGLEVAEKILEFAAALGKSTGLVLVDCSASSETLKLLTQALDFGCCGVMANKKPLTSSLDDYTKLVSQPRRIRYESTVGAGLPVIATINRILSSGDPISRVVGSLSGTLGYLLSDAEEGRCFSQVVLTAKGLGFTEPDPRDDLSGMDVARKALILARLLGHHITLESIKIESLYPENMGPGAMSFLDFMQDGLPQLDQDIQSRINNVSSNGNVLHYVCSIEDSRCEVGFKEVPRDSPLGRLKGSDNLLEIYSKCYSKQPLVIQGAGAGNFTTAAGVLADIIDLQDLFRR